MSKLNSLQIIEDIYSVSKGLKERIVNDLNIQKEKVNCFSFVDEALEFLEKNTPQIIIVDLAMDSVGLPKDDQLEAKNARLTGWVFLKKYVIDGTFKDKLENTHCYIFSGYGRIFSTEIGVTSIDGKIDISKINKKLSEIRNYLYFVPKAGADGGASELIKAIQTNSNELL